MKTPRSDRFEPTVNVWKLVETAYDHAEDLCGDPAEASRLATQIVVRALRRVRRAAWPQSPAATRVLSRTAQGSHTVSADVRPRPTHADHR